MKTKMFAKTRAKKNEKLPSYCHKKKSRFFKKSAPWSKNLYSSVNFIAISPIYVLNGQMYKIIMLETA